MFLKRTLISFLPALALAGPLLVVPRADQQARITSVTPSGPGCPPNTFATETSQDGQVLTVGFINYTTGVGPGISPSDREKSCDLAIKVAFPVGACTSVDITTTYHGFIDLESGTSASFLRSYNLSPGTLTAGGNPPTAVYGAGDGAVYTRADAEAGKVNVRNANEANVSFTVRTRLFVQASNNAATGLASVDDATIAITQQRKC
jgi:hypothetical protein